MSERELERIFNSEWCDADAAGADDNISPQPHEYKTIACLIIVVIYIKQENGV